MRFFEKAFDGWLIIVIMFHSDMIYGLVIDPFVVWFMDLYPP
jgi:hypothetical protein